MKFPEKHYGRIYTDKPENIYLIEQEIKKMDEFEYEYLPKDLIAVYEGQIDYVYTHKFYAIDLDELMQNLWQRGIHAFYVIKQPGRWGWIENDRF